MISPLKTLQSALSELETATEHSNQTFEILSAAQEELLKVQEWELPEE